MNLAVISNVRGYPWAGSEELWLACGLRALLSGHRVTAWLHKDLQNAMQLIPFRSTGGRVREWTSCGFARLENLRQVVNPSFSDYSLGFPDVIVVSAGSLPALSYVPGLARYLLLTRIPVIVLCQFNSECLPISPEERRFGRELLCKAAATVFVSEQNRQLAERQYATTLRGAHVIYNPIRLKLAEPLAYPPPDSPPVFACVARMETLWKAQDLLIEVLAHADWKTRRWSLRLYGEGPDRSHLENCAERFGLSERIEFAGYVRSVEEIWKSSGLLVLPSRGEGTPLAVLEAMMCGRPVVATDVGGNAEVIEDGVTGFIAESPTPRSISRTMERAWCERARWAEIGEAAHRRAIDLANGDPPGLLLRILEKSISIRS